MLAGWAPPTTGAHEVASEGPPGWTRDATHDTDHAKDGSHAEAGVPTVAGEVDRVLARLTAAVDDTTDLPLDGCDPTVLRRIVRTITRQATRLEGLRARTVHTANVTGIVDRSGATSPAAWLAGATGGGTTGAARTAQLGAALHQVPALADAIDTGTVTTDHATALARATARGILDVDQLTHLVDEARVLPAATFTRTLAGAEARADQHQRRRDESLARQRRAVDWRRAADGTVHGTFRLPAIAGETLTTALQTLARPDLADVPAQLRRTPAQRRADALAELAQIALSHGTLPATGGVRPHITITTPVTMLAPTDEDAVAAGAVGTLPDGTVLSAELTRRLMCDATVRRLVLTPRSEPVDVGRATRTWSPAQRTAIVTVDGGCRGPACDRPPGWTELHHIVWWRHGGATSLANGIALCGRCHDLLHHHGWTVHLAPTTRQATWTAPDGTTTTTRPRGPATHGSSRLTGPHDHTAPTPPPHDHPPPPDATATSRGTGATQCALAVNAVPHDPSVTTGDTSTPDRRRR